MLFILKKAERSLVGEHVLIVLVRSRKINNQKVWKKNLKIFLRRNQRLCGVVESLCLGGAANSNGKQVRYAIWCDNFPDGQCILAAF